jgi:superfamily II DNA or RNA helicase/ubiquinone/menaquinone biosynthesis C-methylase UbiE
MTTMNQDTISIVSSEEDYDSQYESDSQYDSQCEWGDCPWVTEHQSELRDWQKDCFQRIYEFDQMGQQEMNISACTGAGKSTVMYRIPEVVQHADRIVYVFPSLALVSQFYSKYLHDKEHVYYLATEGTIQGETTKKVHVPKILDLLKKKTFILLTTYVSVPHLFQQMHPDRMIDILIVDEAHHIEGETYQDHMESYNCVRRVYHFSATLPDGKEADYKYSLLRGIHDGVVRDFNIQIMIGLEHERNKNVLDYLKDVQMRTAEPEKHFSGNSKVMIFTQYSEEKGEEEDIKTVEDFVSVYGPLAKKRGIWLKGITAKTKSRQAILKEFEHGSDAIPHILVSCRTLSEGVDTKRANVVCFWNSLHSRVVIIQRIGRALRAYQDECGKDLPKEQQHPGTIFIPIFLPVVKYIGCKGNVEKMNQLFTEEIQLSENGDFSSVFNVLCALKDEVADNDDEIFREIMALPPKKPKDDLPALATATTATDKGKGKEKETSPGIKRKIRMMFSSELQMMFDLDEQNVDMLDQDNVAKVMCHIEHDGVSLEEKALKAAKEIVSWVHMNKRMPKQISNRKTRESNSNLQMEHRYSVKIHNWKQWLKGNGHQILYPSVKALLDQEIPRWIDDRNLEGNAIQFAKDIIEWVHLHKRMPKSYHDKGKHDSKIENLHAQRLSNWKRSLKENCKHILYPSVKTLLDQEIPGWRDNLEEQALRYAKEIIAWIHLHKRMPKSYRDKSKRESNPEIEIENRFNDKLFKWRQAFKGKITQILYPSVKALLDQEIPQWNNNDDMLSLASSSSKKSSKPELESSPQTTIQYPPKPIPKKKVVTLKKKSMTTMQPTIVHPTETPAIPTSDTQDGTNKKRIKSQLEIYHNKYKKMTSTNLHSHFIEKQDEWKAYHATSEQNELSYGSDIPIQQVIQYLKEKKNKKVKTIVDLGAGTGRLECAFEDKTKFNVIGFDHVSVHPDIHVRNFKDTLLEDECADYVVQCLAMWGTHEDFVKYFEEVHRILDDQGEYILVESSSWIELNAETGEQRDTLRVLLEQNGFSLVERRDGKFLMYIFKKK